MSGHTIQIRSSSKAASSTATSRARRRRQGAGRRARVGRARGRQGHPRARRRVRRLTAILPRRPTCSRARFPGRCAATTSAPRERSQPRLEKIKAGEADMADTLAEIAQAAAVQRPRRRHGLLLRRPLRDPRAEAAWLRRRHLMPRHADARLHPGARRRHRAGLHHLGRPGPRCAAPVLDAYRGVPARMPNVEVHIFPGMLHGYMMRWNTKAFSAPTREFSMGRALALLDGLRDGARLRRAS